MTAYEFEQCENCDFLSDDEFDAVRLSLDEDSDAEEGDNQ